MLGSVGEVVPTSGNVEHPDATPFENNCPRQAVHYAAAFSTSFWWGRGGDGGPSLVRIG